MRLIDADALKNYMAEKYVIYDHTFDDIDAQPTIEPKRGRWITKKDACGIDYQICSNCETEIQWRDRHGVILRVDMQTVPYCPNCGAKMDVSDNDVGEMERSE